MSMWKKAAVIFTLCAVILSVCACAGKGVPIDGGEQDIFSGASPETSALCFYEYDGENVKSKILYNENRIKDVIGKLQKVPIEKSDSFSESGAALPVYAFSIGSKSGETIGLLWTNGYIIDRNGNVYTFDYDFKAFSEDIDAQADWRDLQNDIPTAAIPNIRYIAQTSGGWNKEFLAASSNLISPAGITVSLADWTDGKVKVRFENNSGEEWTYGEYFYLSVLVDGVWYDVPYNGDIGFNEIAYILNAGEEAEKEFDISFYGDLPAGTYRLITQNLFVQKDIK